MYLLEKYTYLLKHCKNSKPRRHRFYQIWALEEWLKHTILFKRKYTSKDLMCTSSVQQFQAIYVAA